MFSIDPQFKMSYDLRQGQDMIAKFKRHTIGDGTNRISSDYEMSHTGGDSQLSEAKVLRWALVAGMALLGIGVGYQLGHDQYTRHRSKCDRNEV